MEGSECGLQTRKGTGEQVTSSENVDRSISINCGGYGAGDKEGNEREWGMME